MSKNIIGKNAKTGVGWQATDTRLTPTDTTRCEAYFGIGFDPDCTQNLARNPDFLANSRVENYRFSMKWATDKIETPMRVITLVVGGSF